MKWEGRRESDNVEDYREAGASGRGGLPLGGRGLGLGGIVIALLASWAFGINPMTVLGLLDPGPGAPGPAAQAPGPRPADPGARFVSVAETDSMRVV